MGAGFCERHEPELVDDQEFQFLGLLDEPRAVGEIFNIGNPEEVSINDLAMRIIDLTDSTSGLTYIPYEQAYEAGFEDMRRRVPSIDKLQALIGYQPSKTLDQMLQIVIEAERNTTVSPQPSAVSR